MKKRPVLYKPRMIDAILEGRKTQTRRIITPQFRKHDHFGYTEAEWRNEKLEYYNYYGNEWCCRYCGDGIDPFTGGSIYKCPYGQIGDILYVKEPYQITCYDPHDERQEVSGYYWTDKQSFHEIPLTDDEWKKLNARKRPMNLTSGLFMYKSLSRIELNILNIRAERIQDITEEDAEAEGCNKEWYSDNAGEENLWPCPKCEGWRVHAALGYNLGVTEVDCCECDTSVKMFEHLWDSIHAYPKRIADDKYIAYPFRKYNQNYIDEITSYFRDQKKVELIICPNPYVWVIEFKRYNYEDM